MNVNRDQLLSMLRNLVSLGAGVLVGKGILTAEQAADLSNEIMIAAPAVIAIATLIWGALSQTDKAKVASVSKMSPDAQQAALSGVSDAAKVSIAEAVPGVATVVVKDGTNGKLGDLAASPDHPNVVTETQNQKDAKNGTKP